MNDNACDFPAVPLSVPVLEILVQETLDLPSNPATRIAAVEQAVPLLDRQYRSQGKSVTQLCTAFDAFVMSRAPLLECIQHVSDLIDHATLPSQRIQNGDGCRFGDLGANELRQPSRILSDHEPQAKE